MNSIFRDPVDGYCWCRNKHPAWDGQHRPDTSDPNWPMGTPTCVCGGGAWGVPHHTGEGISA